MRTVSNASEHNNWGERNVSLTGLYPCERQISQIEQDDDGNWNGTRRREGERQQG